MSYNPFLSLSYPDPTSNARNRRGVFPRPTAGTSDYDAGHMIWHGGPAEGSEPQATTLSFEGIFSPDNNAGGSEIPSTVFESIFSTDNDAGGSDVPSTTYESFFDPVLSSFLQGRDPVRP